MKPEIGDSSPSVQAVLFDWDGTLVDSAEASLRCYVRVFASFGIPFDRGRFAATYSPDWYRTYEGIALPREKWAEADSLWSRFYGEEETRLLAGARDLLTRLRAAGLATGLVTSGSRPRVERELDTLGVASEFDVLVCCEDVSRRKPDPEPLLRALAKMRVEPSRAVYVGDSPEDVAMARASRVYVIGLEGRFPNREALRAAAPDFLARDLEHAGQALEGRMGSR